jgi:hypothetical protein
MNDVYKQDSLLDVTAFFTKLANFSKEHPDLSRECFAEFIKILETISHEHLKKRNTRFTGTHHLHIEWNLLPGSSTNGFKGVFMPPLTFSPPVCHEE